MRALVAVNAATDPLGLLEAPLRAAGIELVLWDAQGERPPARIEEFCAVVALGGATHPDEDGAHPWLRAERDLLRAAVDATLPVLGVCLGAELLAQVLGARTHRLPAPRIGWYPLRAAPTATGDPLAPAWGWLGDVMEWHAYAFELPAGAVLLAGAPAAVQAFRWGRAAWGVQYHLEADAALVAAWLDACADELREAGVDAGAIAAATERVAARAALHGAGIGAAFASLVAAREREIAA
ncbi:MAG TPA: type 1 glutamine amidotransferase [Solirubrobacteraceae bacterium]|jgi:GMP synthase-like glutamine amidotransferase|nr:type 1 glutamine amidotransferase [Solirubrobacteraceae bacterium]